MHRFLFGMNLFITVPVFIVGFLLCVSFAEKQSGFPVSKCDGDKKCEPFTECPQVLKNLKKNETVKICDIRKQISYACCDSKEQKPSSEAVIALSLTEVLPQASKPGVPISQKKCQEYGRFVYTGEDSKTDRCAIKSESIRPGKATYAEFPHMVSIVYHNFTDNIEEHACGGSLISEKFVLTAGVCVFKMEIIFKLRLKWVSLGAIKLNDSSKQTIPAAQTIPHPDYKGWSFWLSHFDIALIKLAWAPILGPELRPACLPRDDENFSGRELILTGWGKNKLDGPRVNNDLLKAILYEVSHGRCEHLLAIETSKPLKVHNASMLCAGHPAKKSSFSKADVGGPLQVISSDVHCMYTIVGVPFFAPPPDFTGTPSVYSRVQYYRRWIENIVWG